jgi:hypothetical protein
MSGDILPVQNYEEAGQPVEAPADSTGLQTPAMAANLPEGVVDRPLLDVFDKLGIASSRTTTELDLPEDVADQLSDAANKATPTSYPSFQSI